MPEDAKMQIGKRSSQNTSLQKQFIFMMFNSCPTKPKSSKTHIQTWHQEGLEPARDLIFSGSGDRPEGPQKTSRLAITGIRFGMIRGLSVLAALAFTGAAAFDGAVEQTVSAWGHVEGLGRDGVALDLDGS